MKMLLFQEKLVFLFLSFCFLCYTWVNAFYLLLIDFLYNVVVLLHILNFSGQILCLAFPELCRKQKSIPEREHLPVISVNLRHPLILVMRSQISCHLRKRCFLKIVQQVTINKQNLNVHPRDSYKHHTYLIFIDMWRFGV